MLSNLEIVVFIGLLLGILMLAQPNTCSLTSHDHQITITETATALSHLHRKLALLPINTLTSRSMLDTITIITQLQIIDEQLISRSNTDQATVVHDKVLHHQATI